MSDTNKQDMVPDNQSEADEEAGLDPGSLGTPLVPVEWLAAVAGVAALLAFQVVVKAFEEEREEKVVWPATPENKNIQLLEEEEEEEEELMAEHYQELEDDDYDDGGEEEEGDDEEDDGGREENEEGAAAAGVYFSEGRILSAETMYKLGYYFHDIVVPKSLSLLADVATAYSYEISDEESEEYGVEEDQEEVGENEELEEGPKKNLDSGGGNFS
nr:tumor rejection antigen P815A-like [Marmota flaviventris]